MNLLLFFHKSVVLRDATEGKLIHQVHFVRVSHVFVLTLYQTCPVNGATSRRTLNDLTTIGKVALNSMTWRSLG